MNEFIYIKQTQYTDSIEKQVMYADKLNIPIRNRLGYQQYSRVKCRDIVALIGHPVQPGDVLHIYNLQIIGYKNDRVSTVLRMFHNAGIRLTIYDTGYDDQVVIQGDSVVSCNDHFDMFNRHYHALGIVNSRRNQINNLDTDKPKPGPPKMTWDSVSPYVRKIVMEYVDNPHRYTQKECIAKLEVKKCGISRPIFSQLAKHYKMNIRKQ
ncbi:MAG: hypothetical protein IKU29_07825 [Parabacteroides sp.]|nr:hypothetical protein [Parabacteroides sp.]